MKQLRLLGLLLTWGFFLSACGGSPQVQEDKPSNETETSTETGEEAEASEIAEADSLSNTEESADKLMEGEYDTMQMLEGTFLGIEQGDYFYVLVRTKQDEDFSFMVIETDPFFDEIFEDPDSHAGKAIRVWYMDTVEYIEEAGGEMEISKYHGAEWIEE